jgi:hypothetical protein
MRWALWSAIDKFERESNYGTSYLHDVIHGCPWTTWLLLRVTGLIAAVLVAGLGFAAPAAAQVADQQAASVYAMSPGRSAAIAAVVVGLIGAAIAGRALARSDGRISSGNRRRGGILALVLGTVAVVIGGLVVATADGGLGTGNGLGGGVVAVIVGLIATALGWLAMARQTTLAERASQNAMDWWKQQ